MGEERSAKDESGHASTSSVLRATPTKRAKRFEQRRSYSPYTKGSPKTPIRRAIGESSLIRTPGTQQASPQSPGMRAISSIISLLTPFASRQARTSAAFGEPDLSMDLQNDEQAGEPNEHIGMDTTKEDSQDETMEDEQNESIYPSLPAKEVTPVPISSHDETVAIRSPRMSIFSSSALSAPRHSTPSRTGFGALGASTSKQATPPSAPVFTFGNSNDTTHVPALTLPSYPRIPARLNATSPLAKNYDLLARFFAEKAEQEARGEEASSSASLQDGEQAGEEGGLTEIEVAGCLRLIEESLTQGRAGELERLRGDAVQRAGLDPVTSTYMDDSRFNRGYMSRSPSLPLGAAAGEMSGIFGVPDRPSSSVSRVIVSLFLFLALICISLFSLQFLSPSYRSDDAAARVNRSLAKTFNSTSAPAKRRHRPLYLGPGQGANAASSLLKKNQQLQRQRKSLGIQNGIRTSALPSWHREEVDQEDRDASGSNAKRQRRLGPEVDSGKEVKQAKLVPSSKSMPTFSFLTPGASSTSTLQEEAPTTPIPPPRTATADAMLNILSSGPSIPLRRNVPVNAASKQKDYTSPLIPDIVNPYQTRSRLSKRTSVAANSDSLAAKEKERLKEEREKKQKMMEESKKKKESTLEMIERTAPTRRGNRRTTVQEDAGKFNKLEAERKEKEVAEEQKKAEKVQKRKQEAEEAERVREQEQKKQKQIADEERQRKTEEVKKRMEKLASQSTVPAPVSDSTTTTTTTTSASEEQRHATNLNESRKSINFGSSFAPKKPSPLSQANNIAPDSPSSSSEASERDQVKPMSFSKPNFSATLPIAVPFVLDSDASQKKINQKSPREQASDMLPTSLPKFDLSVNLLSSNSTASNSESLQFAKDRAVAQLPVFDFVKNDKSVEQSLQEILPKPPAAAASAFSFGTASSTPAKESSDQATTSVSVLENEAKANDMNVSALLSGIGEGEENEDCLHEVRSKVWTLKDGKWADLGIGLFKIKKNKDDAKRRILVRNEGNGKVMVNFRLMKTFKPIKDKNVVSFLGFDSEGKPANYRCRVKTNDMADDLTGALQREAEAV